METAAVEIGDELRGQTMAAAPPDFQRDAYEQSAGYAER